MKWGQDNEKKAFNDFIQYETLKHENLKVNTCGLIIKKDIPFIVSSPDGICACKCCGKSTLEIKCPYVLAYSSPRSIENGYKDVHCLENVNGKVQLKKNS